MGMTHAKRVRCMRADEKANKVRPDTSEVLHEFANGWRVVRMITCGDIRREGYLMRNCAASYVHDKFDEETRTYIKSEYLDTDIAPTRHNGMHLCSLRDDHNLPHLTFWASDHVKDIGAYHNGKIKDTYLALIDEWIEHAGMLDRKKYAAWQEEQLAQMADLLANQVLEYADRAAPQMTEEQFAFYEEAFCHQDDPEWEAAHAEQLEELRAVLNF